MLEFKALPKDETSKNYGADLVPVANASGKLDSRWFLFPEEFFVVFNQEDEPQNISIYSNCAWKKDSTGETFIYNGKGWSLGSTV